MEASAMMSNGGVCNDAKRFLSKLKLVGQW